MNFRKIEEAEKHAQEFLQRVVRYRQADNDPNKGSMPKESGALRRASMDLTRALAEMRRRQ